MLRKIDLRTLRPYVGKGMKPCREMSKSEAKEHYEDFMAQLPERVAYISEVLKANGVDMSQSNPEILEEGVAWIAANGNLVRVESSLPEQFRTSDYVLTMDLYTLSASYHLGVLFGEMICSAVPCASWQMYKGQRRDVDYQDVVVMCDRSMVPLNPCRVMSNCVSAKMKSQDRPAIVSVYERWKTQISITDNS